MTTLTEIRRDAQESFRILGFPTTHDEDWKYTSAAPIARARFVSVPPAVQTGSLAAAIEAGSGIVERHLARYASYKDHAFVAWNTASFEDGAFLEIPSGRAIEEPIHLRFAASPNGKPTVCHPRNLIVVGRGSQVTIVESYLGPDGAVYLTNPVTEIIVGAGAVVEHIKLQQEGDLGYHVSTTQVFQERGSNFTSHSISLGGALVRNDINTVLAGEGGEATLNGLYVATGRQHVDNHTAIDHCKPHCASHELYKGVLAGRSAAVFNGKIFVRQDAQKTDAKQTNKNLLLSEDAVINTKPQLEISADDVRCTHGATVGQLDEEPVFYMRSRGFSAQDARRILTVAFARDITDRIKNEPVRAWLAEMVSAKLNEAL